METLIPIVLFFPFVSTGKRDVKWLPSAAVAGSVLLRQRNSQMNATGLPKTWNPESGIRKKKIKKK